jgi:hypothetical protein
MAALSSNAQQAAARIQGRLFGRANFWRWCVEAFRDTGSSEDAPSERREAFHTLLFAGIALLGAFWGGMIALAEVNALILAVSVLGCAFILRDFRVGVVLLVLLMPISASTMFPHAMLGVTGLNPLNLLLAGTLASCLLHGLFDGSIRRFLPLPLFCLYIVPIVIAGALGSRHIGDIAPSFAHVYAAFDVRELGGYLREMVVKPMFLVIFALLVGAAVSRSNQPEKFLVPTLVSIWVMGSMVIVFVFLSGVGLGKLASSHSREFLSPLGMHANELGRLYAVAYALLLFTWAESKQPGLKLALLASMGLVILALMLTFSRGAFFGFVVVNLLFLLWRLNARNLVFAGVLAVGALFLLPDAVYDRVATGFGGGGGLNAITAGRWEWLWLPLLPEVLRSPIYGSGLGSILWSEPMRVAGGAGVLIVSHPHNAYLQAALDMGIAGLILLCAYFIHVWKGFRKLSVDPALSPTLRGFYQGAAAGLASFLIAAITDSSLTPRPEQAFLWLAIGMMYGQRAKKPIP